MKQHEVSRTLVKSPPELWAELSDASSLARHLDQFGEIRITRLEPETAVAWEGERASGTVRIEPSGWGTRVILKATAGAIVEEAPAGEEVVEDPAGEEIVAEEPVAVAGPEPVAVADVDPGPVADVDPGPAAVSAAPPTPAHAGFFARLRGMLGGREGVAAPEPVALAPVSDPEPVVAPEPPAEPEPEPVAEPVAVAPSEPAARSPAPALASEPAADPEPGVDVALTAALDSLGQAHHRPFSRG